MPYADLEPFGRESKAQSLTEASIKEGGLAKTGQKQGSFVVARYLRQVFLGGRGSLGSTEHRDEFVRCPNR